MREQLAWKGVKHRLFFGKVHETVWLVEAQGTVRLEEVPGTVWLVEAQGTVCLGRGARNSLISRSMMYSFFAGRGASKSLVGRSARNGLFGRDAEQFYW